MADLSAAANADASGVSIEALATFAIREVVGGIGLGLALGYVGYRALKSIDDHPLELLITLALVMFLYSLSFWIHVACSCTTASATTPQDSRCSFSAAVDRLARPDHQDVQ